MWLFTKQGFFSIVKPEYLDNDSVMIRARCAKDLKRLRKIMPNMGETKQTPKADYPYRAFIKVEDFAVGLARVALDVDYGNFKNKVAETLGREREQQLHEVWSAMQDLNPPGMGLYTNMHAFRQRYEGSFDHADDLPFDWYGIERDEILKEAYEDNGKTQTTDDRSRR